MALSNKRRYELRPRHDARTPDPTVQDTSQVEIFALKV